ncbi:MAG: hypothetical protein JO190_07490 [Candidatus Eremiobacteraeota bacterium]|nr:hypothetical protein [Candidatus Eremiobacteraeota bacterium]
MLAIVGCSANSGLTPVSGTSTQQQSVGVPMIVPFHAPHYMATSRMANHNARSNILLTYGGGPVLVAPKAYVIYWGYGIAGDPDGVKPLLTKYLKVMGGSGHNNIYTQYYETVGSKTTYITNPHRQFGGAWIDDIDSVPASPTDAQVAAEAAIGEAHFGYDPNGEYIVAIAHGHSPAGFGTQWCAYHNDESVGGKVISFTNLPYMPDANPPSNCGANIIAPPSDESGTDEGVTIVEGHEYGESVTDPVLFNGWNSSQGEIGDLCAWQNIQNDPFRTKSYTSQPMFDNKTAACEQSGP